MSRRAPIWQAEYDRTGRSWGFNYLLKGLGDGFDAQAGFVNRLRSGVVNGHAFNRFTIYGDRGALLENLTMFFGPDRTWLYDDFGFKEGLEGFEQFEAIFQLRGGWELNAHLQRDFVKFQDTSFAGYTAGSAAGPSYLPPDDFSGVNWTAKVATPTWRRLGAERLVPAGTGADLSGGRDRARGRRSPDGSSCAPRRPCASRRAGPSFHLYRRDGKRVRPRPSFRGSRPSISPIGRCSSARSGSTGRSAAPRCRPPTAATRSSSTARPSPRCAHNGLRLDLLASFEPTPGTVAFLGYGSSLETDADFNWSRLERVSDGFFVKLAYQLRY